MKIIYTKQTEDKLQEPESRKLRITKAKLEKIVKKPIMLQELQTVKRAISGLDESHSLCVIYKLEGDVIKIITFFPAEVGRYENKVL